MPAASPAEPPGPDRDARVAALQTLAAASHATVGGRRSRVLAPDGSPANACVLRIARADSPGEIDFSRAGRAYLNPLRNTVHFRGPAGGSTVLAYRSYGSSRRAAAAAALLERSCAGPGR